MFDTEVAKEVGADAASLFQGIQHFVFYNESNERNFFDGEHWTFDTSKAIAKRFSYLNEQQVKRLLAKLVDTGFIKKGNYNKTPFDRTVWYTLTEKGKKYAELTRVQIQTIDSSKMNNGEFKNELSESSKMNNQIVQNRPTNTNYIPNNIPSNTQKDILVFGEFKRIKLTQENYNELVRRYGKQDADRYIAELDRYLDSNPSIKVQRYFSKLITWAENDKKWHPKNARTAPTAEPFDKHAQFKDMDPELEAILNGKKPKDILNKE